LFKRGFHSGSPSLAFVSIISQVAGIVNSEVENVMVEIKAISQVAPEDYVQALNYVKASGSQRGSRALPTIPRAGLRVQSYFINVRRLWKTKWLYQCLASTRDRHEEVGGDAQENQAKEGTQAAFAAVPITMAAGQGEYHPKCQGQP
jgi:hypothetical protein